LVAGACGLMTDACCAAGVPRTGNRNGLGRVAGGTAPGTSLCEVFGCGPASGRLVAGTTLPSTIRPIDTAAVTLCGRPAAVPVCCPGSCAPGGAVLTVTATTTPLSKPSAVNTATNLEAPDARRHERDQEKRNREDI
jgi:hypothetical protein